MHIILKKSDPFKLRPIKVKPQSSIPDFISDFPPMHFDGSALLYQKSISEEICQPWVKASSALDILPFLLKYDTLLLPKLSLLSLLVIIRLNHPELSSYIRHMFLTFGRQFFHFVHVYCFRVSWGPRREETCPTPLTYRPRRSAAYSVHLRESRLRSSRLELQKNMLNRRSWKRKELKERYM